MRKLKSLLCSSCKDKINKEKIEFIFEDKCLCGSIHTIVFDPFFIFRKQPPIPKFYNNKTKSKKKLYEKTNNK